MYKRVAPLLLSTMAAIAVSLAGPAFATSAAADRLPVTAYTSLQAGITPTDLKVIEYKHPEGSQTTPAGRLESTAYKHPECRKA